jgi:lipoprotein-anchoring transpeptidase ErfK/SrfK
MRAVRRPRPLRTLAIAALALAAVAPAGLADDGAAPAPATGVSPASGTPQVGAPTASIAWTARVLQPVIGRAAPRAGAGAVERIMHYTAFSRRPQILLVTGAATGPSGARWVRVQLPRRPNGSEAWIPAAATELSSTGVRLRIRTRSHRVEVWRDGRLAASYPAAVGTGSTPTPVGRFAIQDPVASSASQRSYLGPYILTLTAHSAVLRSFMGGDGLVAIHGTNAPGLLGHSVSHGCVRVSNAAVTSLREVATPGTPVEIERS